MIPATVTCSYAFMLPVATPPNAIVFAAAKMTPGYMVSLQLVKSCTGHPYLILDSLFDPVETEVIHLITATG